jgi:hypothetical protein
MERMRPHYRRQMFFNGFPSSTSRYRASTMRSAVDSWLTHTSQKGRFAIG